MGLCKCQRRKVTNLFCFEHDVNVCEYCLVADHERDSDYNPICILCKQLLKDEPTVRLICYDVFHWSCLNKYAAALPANTAPAGYQCPKCKECLFPPQNLVSPVVEVLRTKLETADWAKIGLTESLVQVEEDSLKEAIRSEQFTQEPASSLASSSISTNGNQNNTVTDEESNGYVVVKPKQQQSQPQQPVQQQNQQQQSSNFNKFAVNKSELTGKAVRTDLNLEKIISEPSSHNRLTSQQHNQFVNQQQDGQYYDSSLGIVLNIENLDRDTGDYKYQRRPVFEWLSRWLRSRQINRRFRMTRQKKILFLVVLVFMCIFTLIIVFSRLGEMNTENDPALDPMNNPNIRVQ